MEISGQDSEIQVSVENSVLQQKIFDDLEVSGHFQLSGHPLAKVFFLESTEIMELTGLVRSSGNYALLKWLDMQLIQSINGSGFSARVLEDGIKDGALKVILENPGSGYVLPPKVILEGGRFKSIGSITKEPLSITAGSKVLLMADTFDFDGEVECVRFLWKWR